MKRIRTGRPGIRRERSWPQDLPVDPRDPDVVRAKALARARPTGSSRTNRAAGAFVVALAARRSWFCCHRLVAVLLQFGRRRTGLAEKAALGRAVSWARALAGAEARGQSPSCWPPARPGWVGRWGPADRPCGICGPFSLWPLGRYRAGPVIPSVGGVPGLPA